MQNAPKLTINKIDKIKKEAMLAHCFHQNIIMNLNLQLFLFFM